MSAGWLGGLGADIKMGLQSKAGAYPLVVWSHSRLSWKLVGSPEAFNGHVFLHEQSAWGSN